MQTEAATTALAQALEEDISRVTDLPTSVSEVNEYLHSLFTMLETFAVTYGGRLLIALILLIIGFKLVNLMTKKIGKTKAVSKLEPSTKGFVQSLIGVTAKVIIGITALAIVGIPMTSIIAVIGSCGLAIGLALQGSLANIAGGFIIMLLRPFRAGDYVTAGDVEGVIRDIGIFHTKLITLDNRVVLVPNSVISNATLTNYSTMETRRVDLTFTASYQADIATVERVLLETCRAHEKVLDDPAPFARLSGHLDSALEYTVRVWCRGEDYWDVHFDLLRDVKNAFDKNGIPIPYPQLDVHSK